jgi:hypothetical protein
MGDGTIHRVKLILCETVLNGVALHPEGQVVTVGTDKRITWWGARDGMKLRSLEGKLERVGSNKTKKKKNEKKERKESNKKE